MVAARSSSLHIILLFCFVRVFFSGACRESYFYLKLTSDLILNYSSCWPNFLIYFHVMMAGLSMAVWHFVLIVLSTPPVSIVEQNACLTCWWVRSGSIGSSVAKV